MKKKKKEDELDKLVNLIHGSNPIPIEEIMRIKKAMQAQRQHIEIPVPEAKEKYEGYMCRLKTVVTTATTPEISKTIFYPGGGMIIPTDDPNLLRDDRYYRYSALKHSNYFEWVRQTRESLALYAQSLGLPEETARDHSIKNNETICPAIIEYGEDFRKITTVKNSYITIYDDGFIILFDRDISNNEVVMNTGKPVENISKKFNIKQNSFEFANFFTAVTEFTGSIGKDGGSLQLMAERALNGKLYDRFSVEFEVNLIPEENRELTLRKLPHPSVYIEGGH